MARPRGDRWHIVIAGDFIDLIGMTIAHGADTGALATALTDEAELRTWSDAVPQATA